MPELTLAAVEQLVQTYHGFVHAPDLYALARYASRAEGPALEVGSYQGLSSIVLATWCPHLVYCVDFHAPGDGDNYPFGPADRRCWTENVLKAGVAEKTCAVNMDSKQVARGWNIPLGLLFIDGGHSQEAVEWDLKGFLKHVLPGGVVALHDHGAPQIQAAIAKFKNLTPLEVVNMTGFYRRG